MAFGEKPISEAIRYSPEGYGVGMVLAPRIRRRKAICA